MKPKYKAATTPFLDDASFTDEELVAVGALAPFAASVLMKILWGARCGRWDLLRQISFLASHIHRWTLACDKYLFRLMCYIAATLDFALTLSVGDDPADWELWYHSDADLAGCKDTKRSTSGSIVSIGSKNTFAPLSGHSGKQPSTSEASTEAETVALNKGLHKAAIPLLDLFRLILSPQRILLRCFEDNEACITVVKNGYSNALRSLKRTHGVSIARLHEYFHGHLNDDKSFILQYVSTDFQRADIFTKAFKSTVTWLRAVDMLGIHRFDEVGLSVSKVC